MRRVSVRHRRFDRRFSSRAGSAQAGEEVSYFIESDTDKDGLLSQAEWDASGRSPKRLARVDADKDGKVSRAELHEATVAAKAAAEAQSKP